jgi:outer membrane protease
MKNISLFIFFVSTLGIFFHTPGAAAEPIIALPFGNLPYSLSASASFGMLYGQSEEIVYSDIDPDKYLSQLLWDIKPLWYHGYSLSYGLADPRQKAGLFAELLLRSGIPAGTGIMEDRDWMASDYGFSHFSAHTNFTRSALLADIGFGVSVPLGRRLFLRAGLWFSYMRFFWDSVDGYMQHAADLDKDGIYDPWADDIPKKYHFGPAISYSQRWLVFSPGLSLGFPFGKYFSLDISMLLGPLVNAEARDVHHNQPDREFQDHMSSGAILYEPRGEFTFSPNKNLAFSWNIGCRFLSGARGSSETRISFDSSESGIGGYQSLSNESGAALRFLETGITFTLRL